MRALPLALALLLVLAGCSASDPSADPTASPTGTLTPAPVETPSPTPDYPPGVNASGVERPAQLVNAHTTALTGRSFTARHTVALRYDNGTRVANVTERMVVGAVQSRFRYAYTAIDRRQTPPRTASYTFVSNGSVVVQRQTYDDDPSYRVLTGPDGDPLPPSRVYAGGPRFEDRLLALLYAGDYAVAAEPPITRLRGGDFVDDDNPFSGLVTNATVTEATLTVGPDGFVRGFRLTFEGEYEGQPVTGTERLTYSAVGETTVRQPAWYDEAVAAWERPHEGNATETARALAAR